MFFMQRVTWSGVAMHKGVLPGYPASHGCIRLPRDFAARLWPTTKLGVRVFIARSEVAPVDFKHPALFAPARKPDPVVASIGSTDGMKPQRRMVLAQASTAANDATSETYANATVEIKPASAGAEEDKSAVAAATPTAPTPTPVPTAHSLGAEAPPTVETSVGDSAAGREAIPLPRRHPLVLLPTTAPQATVPLPRRNPQPLSNTESDATAAIVPLPMRNPLLAGELRKSVEPLQPTEPAPDTVPAAAIEGTRADFRADKSQPSIEALGTTPAPAPAAAEAAVSDDPDKPKSGVSEPPKPGTTRTRSADQPAKRAGQVAVFVSRKEKKIFVRHGFIPIFEMPIAIENADQPLGTHVFTAMAFTDGGAGMRWNLITMPEAASRVVEETRSRIRGTSLRRKPQEQPVVETRAPSNATEALDRIQIPKEAAERISELLIPGSSLIVSDHGLGRETGRYTEFIVLTR